jgi:hypothetical protein
MKKGDTEGVETTNEVSMTLTGKVLLQEHTECFKYYQIYRRLSNNCILRAIKIKRTQKQALGYINHWDETTLPPKKWNGETSYT